MSLVRNLKGIGSKGDLFSANLFPMDVSRGVHTFEVPSPELKRVLVVPSQTGSHWIWVRSKSHEGHLWFWKWREKTSITRYNKIYIQIVMLQKLNLYPMFARIDIQNYPNIISTGKKGRDIHAQNSNIWYNMWSNNQENTQKTIGLNPLSPQWSRQAIDARKIVSFLDYGLILCFPTPTPIGFNQI